MAKQQFRAKNHYVPEGYLRRWAGSDGRLSVYRVLVSHPNVEVWATKSPGAVARHQHLYTRAAAGSDSDEIERWLDREFESPAQAAISKAVSGAKLSIGDYRCLARFVAVQDVRTPARLMEILARGREHVEDTLNDSVERSVRELEANLAAGKPIDLKSPAVGQHFPARVKVERGHDPSTSLIRVEAIVGRSYWLFAIQNLLTKTVTHLEKHRWTVLRAPRGVRWLTSDDPVVKLNWYEPGKYDFKGGWGSTNTEILLPLDPGHLLYTKVGARPPPRGTGLTVEEAQVMQQCIIEHAHRHVFATEPDSIVEQIRPRTVDAALYGQEAEQWKRWHDEQSAAERGLEL